VFDSLTWHRRAACRGEDRLFLSDRAGKPKHLGSATVTLALAICSTCEVRRECLEEGPAGHPGGPRPVVGRALQIQRLRPRRRSCPALCGFLVARMPVTAHRSKQPPRTFRGGGVPTQLPTSERPSPKPAKPGKKPQSGSLWEAYSRRRSWCFQRLRSSQLTTWPTHKVGRPGAGWGRFPLPLPWPARLHGRTGHRQNREPASPRLYPPGTPSLRRAVTHAADRAGGRPLVPVR
jgi:hypothetical protein